MEVAVGLLVPERIEDKENDCYIISIGIWENHIVTYEENNLEWEGETLLDSKEATYIDGEETCEDYDFESNNFITY